MPNSKAKARKQKRRKLNEKWKKETIAKRFHRSRLVVEFVAAVALIVSQSFGLSALHHLGLESTQSFLGCFNRPSHHVSHSARLDHIGVDLD